MPIFTQQPPVPGSVELTKTELESLNEFKVRPFYASDEENEQRRVQFASTASDIGKEILKNLVPRSDSGLNPDTLAPSLGIVAEIAYGVGGDCKFGPTRTGEFTLGVIQGALEELGRRQNTRFNELMHAGLYE